MGYKIDLRSWKVFGTLQPSFIHEIRMAMVVGKKTNFIKDRKTQLYACTERIKILSKGCAEAGIVVTRNNHVFRIGSGPCLGVKDTIHTTVPLELAELSGEKVKGNFHVQFFPFFCELIPISMWKIVQEFIVDKILLSCSLRMENCSCGETIQTDNLALVVMSLLVHPHVFTYQMTSVWRR